jgi:hypothetical protein
MIRFIILFIKITFPGNIEQLLNDANLQNNIEIYNCNLIIYYSRNLFFGYTTISILFFCFNFNMISYYFITFGLLNYIYHFYKWIHFIHNSFL